MTQPEPKYEFEPFPITDGNEYNRSKKWYRRYKWILERLPLDERKLVALMNFCLGRTRKENAPFLKQLLMLGLLIKSNGKIVPTKKFINYVKDLANEIERYEKENKKACRKDR